MLIKILKYLLFLTIGGILLVLAFKNQDPLELLKNLLEVKFNWVLLSILFGALAIISRGMRWNLLLKSLGHSSSSKANSIYATAVGYFTNIAIPRAGEITRCTSLSQVEKIPINQLFGTIILERIIDLIILVLLIGVVFLLKFNQISDFFLSVGDNNGSNTVLNILFWLIISITFSFILLFIFRNIIKKMSFYEKIQNFFQGLKEGLSSITKIKNKSAFWMHTIFIWLMYFMMTYICFMSIPETEHLTMSDGLFIMVVGGLGMVVPTQGGIGSYHLAVKIGMLTLGIAAVPALLFAFTVHTAQTLMTMLFGSISLLLLFVTKKKSNAAS